MKTYPEIYEGSLHWEGYYYQKAWQPLYVRQHSVMPLKCLHGSHWGFWAFVLHLRLPLLPSYLGPYCCQTGTRFPGYQTVNLLTISPCIHLPQQFHMVLISLKFPFLEALISYWMEGRWMKLHLLLLNMRIIWIHQSVE